MPQVLDFVAQSYTTHSRPLNAARCVNFFAEQELQDAKSKAPVGVWGVPGISPFTDTGDGPIKAFNIMNDVLYAVGGTALWQINSDATVVNLGAQGAVDRVSIDNNGVQLCWVDGSSGWYFQPGGAVTQIVDINFSPSNTITYFDGYFCFPRLGTKEFFLSPLFGVTPFDGALFASKEATSDLLLAIANSHEQLYLFGQARTEVWFDAGNPAPMFPFQRSDGAIIQRGTIAPLSIVLEDNTLFFLGDDLIFYRVNGFVPERISNHAVENAWAQYDTVSDCKALVYTIFGHKMITLTFPTAQTTWVIDLSTRRWHERESWLGTSAADSIGRWRGNCTINAFGRTLVGDVASGKIGQLSSDVFTEWTDPIRGLIDGPPIHTDRRRVFMKRFEIDVETGVGISQPNTTAQVGSYCLNAVTITQPTVLETAGALADTSAGIGFALFSVWLDIPDGGNTTGILFSGPGLQIVAQNDATGAPEISVTATDQVGDQIVAASFTFANWTTWVDLLVSLDTAGQRLQVWALTIVAGVLVETEMTPTAIAWGSTLPLDSAGPWLLEPWPQGATGGGSGPVLQWTDGFETYPVGFNTITAPWVNTSPVGPPDGLSSLISNSVFKFGAQSLGVGVGGGSAEGAGIVMRSFPPAGTLGPILTVDLYLYMPSGTTANDPPVSNAPGFHLFDSGSDSNVVFLMGGLGTCEIGPGGGSPWNTFSLSLDTWHRVTWQLHMAAVGGTSSISLDGGAALTYTGDTRTNGGSPTVDNFVAIGQFVVGSPPVEIYFDDVSLYEGIFTPGTDNSATLADLFFAAPTVFYDLSVAANRRAFVGTNGSSSFPGFHGELPTGSVPAVFLSRTSIGTADSFADNLGVGGAFAITGGDLATAAAQPPCGAYAIPIDLPDNEPIGVDPQVRLSVSDNGGRSFLLLQKWRSMGKIGEYTKRLRWLKMGQFRQRMIRLEITDPVRRNLVGFYLDVSEGLE